MLVSGYGYKFDETVDDLVHLGSFGLRVVTEQNAMTQDVVHDCLHVIGAHKIATAEPGEGARTLVQTDGSSRAGANLNPTTQFLVIQLGSARGLDERDNILLDRWRHFDGVNFFSGFKDGLLRNQVGCDFC